VRVAIMQPYFFPYIGYFQLLKAADNWVSFDDTQFVNKGWINRNRILHPDTSKEWQYITLPLNKRGRFDKICDISIKSDEKWRDQIIGKLTSYKRKAPFYTQTIDFVESCFETDETNLSKFLVRSLKLTADYLGIETPIRVQSNMKLSLNNIEHPGQWALRIAEIVGASEYINPHGGNEIFNEREFDDAGIKLRFLKPILNPYKQRRDVFVPGLSIIDVMMWNDMEKIHQILSLDYEILQKTDLKI